MKQLGLEDGEEDEVGLKDRAKEKSHGKHNERMASGPPLRDLVAQRHSRVSAELFPSLGFPRTYLNLTLSRMCPAPTLQISSSLGWGHHLCILCVRWELNKWL